MIKPTVGRVVLYRPTESDVSEFAMAEGDRLAAIVAYVHSDTHVNLTVCAPNGQTFGRSSVALAQDAIVPAPGQCEWMPYQKAVASGALTPNLHADKPSPLTASETNALMEKRRIGKGVYSNPQPGDADHGK